MQRLQLNGWHRLWIVLSILWIFPVVYYGYKHYPGTMTTFKDFGPVSCVITPTDGVDGDSLKEAVDETVADIESKMTATNTCHDLFEAIDKAGMHSLVNVAYKEKFKEKLHSFYEIQSAAYFLPVIGLYLLGFTVAWVIKGFKKSSTQLL